MQERYKAFLQSITCTAVYYTMNCCFGIDIKPKLLTSRHDEVEVDDAQLYPGDIAPNFDHSGPNLAQPGILHCRYKCNTVSTCSALGAGGGPETTYLPSGIAINTWAAVAILTSLTSYNDGTLLTTDHSDLQWRIR